MKKILLSLMVCAMLGCSGSVYLQRTFIGDFRGYSKSGFVLSPSFSGYAYEPVGIIEIQFRSGEKKGYRDTTSNVKPVVLFGQTEPVGDIFIPTYDYIVSELVLEAKKLGANGILGLKIERVITPNIESVDYIASGFGVIIKGSYEK